MSRWRTYQHPLTSTWIAEHVHEDGTRTEVNLSWSGLTLHVRSTGTHAIAIPTNMLDVLKSAQGKHTCKTT